MEGLQNMINNQTVMLLEKSMGERLQIGVLYTVLGMAIVFAVLILISLMISLFKYIPKIQARFEGKTEKKIEDVDNNPVDNTIAQIQEREEQELMENLELVSVITAAIQAYQGDDVPEDGFIVRSIRKTNYGKR